LGRSRLARPISQFDLEGIADGVIGRSGIGRITTPYLVMIETKRGIEAQNPIFSFMVNFSLPLG